jgi:tetratricopeptide (TPR) repeat protein
MPSLSQHLLSCVVAVAVALVGTPVVAASSVEPEATDGGATAVADPGEEAKAAFAAKDFDKAIALFEQAYAKTGEPNYLFNIGRVYEEKGDIETAVAKYQEFVKQPGVELEARQIATDRLKVLRQTLEQLEADENQGQAITPDRPPTAEEQQEAERRRKMRLAGYSLLGVGGAALVIGAVFGSLAIGKSNDAKDTPFVDEKVALRNEARVRAVVGDAMLATGGVLAGVGLVLVLSTLGKRSRGGKVDKTASRREDRRAHVRVAPGIGSLMLSGAF